MLGFFKSIRTRLTLWYSLILLTTLVAFGLIAYTYSREQLLDNLDKSLLNEVHWVRAIIEPRGSGMRPSKKFVSKKKTIVLPEQPPLPEEGQEPSDADEEVWNQIYEHALMNWKKTMIEVTDKSGLVVFRSFTVGEENPMVGEVPLDTTRIITVRSERGTDFRVVATATKMTRIYVAYPLGEVTEVLDNLFSIFLILIPIALAISIGGGWFLAYTSLRPVDEITKAAREISAHNLATRIPPRAVQDEIGRLVATFNDMIERLRLSFDRIRQFSVDASHELRTPLTIMRGEVELALRNTKEPEEYRRVLVSNLEEILRLATIIDSLLALAKADADLADIPLQPVNIRDLIAELYEDSEVIASKKQITVRLSRNTDAVVLGDPVRLRQLFLNLLDNAVKYTPEGGTVILSADRTEAHAVIRVADTGVGIAPEEQNKIFDRFYRVEKGRSRDMGGSGLGLSIAQWIVGLHHGTIAVESEPGAGSTFIVTLPLS
ncbi:MAG TPA: ATP-binding protein [Bacteroidota bacterium]|nr:ATP-binding protein [Bacteroidota bacterium]